MRADELTERYGMELHVERGMFTERHYAHDGAGRAASGCIYYAVTPGEHTEFHRIDCDEYWCFHAGCTLEVWVIDAAGGLTVRHLGTEPGAEPTVRLAAGELFAARLAADAPDSAFVTCITVPRFRWDGFEMLGRAEVTALCPAVAAFWE